MRCYKSFQLFRTAFRLLVGKIIDEQLEVIILTQDERWMEEHPPVTGFLSRSGVQWRGSEDNGDSKKTLLKNKVRRNVAIVRTMAKQQRHTTKTSRGKINQQERNIPLQVQ